MVAAFLKLGIPTMMSALPRRAISSRMAGVRAVWGTSPPYHHGGGGAMSPAAARPDLPLHLAGSRPVVVWVSDAYRRAADGRRTNAVGLLPAPMHPRCIPDPEGDPGAERAYSRE